MIQWGKPIFFSLGVHVDFRLRYIDLHLVALILTLGNLDYEDYQAWWSSRSK